MNTTRRWLAVMVGSLVLLTIGSSDLLPITAVHAATITVDRTDDTAAASACTAAPNDCSLRGAVVFANANAATTINIPAGLYELSIDGTSESGLCTNPSIGDLDVTMSNTIIMGAGPGTNPATATIIQQTTPHDRVVCVNPTLAPDFNFTTTLGFSPVPEDADTGEGYDSADVVSNGPYQIAEYTTGNGGKFILERNPNWDPASDPIRKAYPDSWEVHFGIDPKIMDQRLIRSAGDDAFAVQKRIRVRPRVQAANAVVHVGCGERPVP